MKTSLSLLERAGVRALLLQNGSLRRWGRGKGRGGILRRDSRQENSRLVVETTRQNYNLGFFHLVHEPILITRRKGESVVLLSLDDYESILESEYLLSSPANAARLQQSLEESRSGKRTSVDALGL